MANSSQSSDNPSSSEHQQQSSEEDSTDWISELPDSVVCHILSFLPTQTAVATSILSKRWQFLWTFVPYIDLYEYEIVNRFSFGDIVNKVLGSRRDCCIKRLQLRNCLSWDPNHVKTWVSLAMERNVEEIDLKFYGNCGDFEIPFRLLFCRTLVVLKLEGSEVMMNVPSSVYLPNLKVLHLLWVSYKDDKSICNLLAGCPVLVELHVCSYLNGNIVNYEITSPSLISLTLEFREGRTKKVYLKNLCRLVEANINVDASNRFCLEGYEGAVDVIRGVNNVKFLELSHDTMRALIIDPSYNFPSFHNLVRLKLTGFCCFWGLLLELLDNSSFLEHLIISKYYCLTGLPGPCHCGDFERWIQPPNAPTCLSSHLRTFCFEYGFMGVKDDMEFVRFILGNSLVLENMTITFWPQLNSKRKFAVQQNIEKFGKSSEKCQLQFV